MIKITKKNKIFKKRKELNMRVSILVLLAIYISAAACAGGCTYTFTLPDTNWPSVVCAAPDVNACNTTTSLKQSPINIDRKTVSYPATTTETNIETTYTGVGSLKIKNNSHTQVVTIVDGTITLDSTIYTIAQYHWHQPAEHTFDGKYYDAELHFVHANAANTTLPYLVIAVYFQIGEENAWLKENSYSSAQAVSASETSLSGKVDAWGILESATSQGVFEYEGSFTTPPCTQGVKFLLTRVAQTMSMAQWTAFKTSLASYVSMDYT